MVGGTAPGGRRLFGSWRPGDPSPSAAPEKEQTWDCGGTSHHLPAERARATFAVSDLTELLDGGRAKTARRRWLWSAGEEYDNSLNHQLTRSELHAQHLERFIGLHRKYAEDGFRPTVWDISMMSCAARNFGAMQLHYAAFTPTLMAQMSQEQQLKWLLPAYRMDIVGALAQTELGHGSNVRALQTTAEYDVETEEFVLNTPTLQAMKWWPGGLGKSATHCALYAQLIVGGVEVGFHTFLLQLRDDTHRPLPGITLGEIGPKFGDNMVETGFLRLDGVRIPRDWMMAKNQHVTADGRYVKARRREAGGGKLMYSTMLQIRAGLVLGAGYRLAQGVTIATRYSCVRHQGFVDSQKSAESGRFAAERPVLDYQNQQFRVFKQLAACYAMVFAGKELSDQFSRVDAAIKSDDASAVDMDELAVVHATSAGLKALACGLTADGLEDCRKCCGGHGVLLASGVAHMAQDYATYCTAEGDRVVLELQAAKFLLREASKVAEGHSPSAACDYLADPLLATHSMPENVTLFELDAVESLFRRRARLAVETAARRFREAVAQPGITVDEATNRCAIDLVAASQAHGRHLLLRSFAAHARAASPPATQRVLRKLCLLFANVDLQEHGSDWCGLLSPRHHASIRSAVRKLLCDLRPEAVALVDAFEFPDNVLASALGRHDGNVYESLYAAACVSPLNQTDPFPGYERVLQPHLDKELLRENARLVRAVPRHRL